MRIAIVTESFLPTLNGVTTSVCRVLDCLRAAGHEALVVCPGPAPSSYQGFPVHTVMGVTLRQFRVGLPSYDLERVLKDFQPDVVHAASPFGLGARGLAAARNLRIPAVAIYQTDMPSYLKQHGGRAGGIVEKASWRWIRHLHTLADLTLVPSSQTLQELSDHGVPRTALWSRGVDTVMFDPDRRHEAEVSDLRDMLAPRGETIVGYVGRLAPEKEVHRLAEIADLPGVSLCIVGDGPSRASLERLLPRASFLGYRSGLPLAHAYAALDVFAHTGTKETFGQTLQEAMAAGLPVVAPAAGGPLDIVRPGVTGLLFDPDHGGALRQAVGGLVADATMRERMGSAGRAKVADRSWAGLVDELVAYYQSVIEPSWSPRTTTAA
ncbi:glycosyltransferase family 4 protein [Luteipulveratus mongoliensis]|uniref:D-inositol 3-phosphate glycosyltransferase n=1 Tax=Luteipulveratus mongoliensis TaxID=571913 RepID=A0A0K1JHC6_9MICO|nr:glycosyltransferase family 1 protein [Luteipulveratus mongoliensis]AKU16122.1 glycosyl transferase [Luteipulveratus mongoliensis]